MQWSLIDIAQAMQNFNGFLNTYLKKPLVLKKRLHNKGHLISKRFLGSSISFKKRTNEFVFTTMRRAFVRFLEEIDDPKKSFRN